MPGLFNHWDNMPRNRWGRGVFVGYEDFGKTLLYMNSDIPEPEKILFSELSRMIKKRKLKFTILCAIIITQIKSRVRREAKG